MFVGDEYGIEFPPLDADFCESQEQFTGRKACIDEELAVARVHEDRISLASTGKQTNPHIPSRQNTALSGRNQGLPLDIHPSKSQINCIFIPESRGRFKAYLGRHHQRSKFI
jgi:hypothetical protein